MSERDDYWWIDRHRAWWIRAQPVMRNYRYEKNRNSLIGEGAFWRWMRSANRPLKNKREWNRQWGGRTSSGFCRAVEKHRMLGRWREGPPHVPRALPAPTEKKR